ncbi:LysR family transcriptional regulator [Yersinia rochesterensis]|uniref:LysR family transcriptional regulator n=1 Tax=Yersinia rochesterensis TaxID=1604335 RepID=UPI002853081A|nr:LysR family transcriptional regulator [Yersinia rochesterensis]MDR5017962.1 LysR family transcriptional regulator [Yersinia rochesterensis]
MFISKNLLVFITTVQEGSLTNAAIKLFSTPPPMSRSIKILEEELGFKLFTRATSGLKLTDKGSKFYKDIFPTYTRLVEMSKIYKRSKSGTINIGTHQLKSTYAGFICDYFLSSGNCNIESQENITDINQLDIVISAKEIKKCDFDVKLVATCKAILLYASHLNDLPNKIEHLKKLPFLQSNLFSSSCAFKDFFEHMKQQGFRGEILHVDNQRVRYNLIEKGAGISLTAESFSSEKDAYKELNISYNKDVDLEMNYYIYLKSSVIKKDFFITYVQKNSLLSWREVNITS